MPCLKAPLGEWSNRAPGFTEYEAETLLTCGSEAPQGFGAKYDEKVAQEVLNGEGRETGKQRSDDTSSGRIVTDVDRRLGGLGAKYDENWRRC